MKESVAESFATRRQELVVVVRQRFSVLRESRSGCYYKTLDARRRKAWAFARLPTAGGDAD
ncbi:MAG: hypothetical protein ACP5FY_09725, partial [Kosmotogaceae bacterium]